MAGCDASFPPGGAWSTGYIVVDLDDFRAGDNKYCRRTVQNILWDPAKPVFFPLKEAYDRARRTVRRAVPESGATIVHEDEGDKPAEPEAGASHTDTVTSGGKPPPPPAVDAAAGGSDAVDTPPPLRVHSAEPAEPSLFPPGFSADGERVVRARAGTTRPAPIWPEAWQRMSPVAQAKAKADWDAGRPLKADYRSRGSKLSPVVPEGGTVTVATTYRADGTFTETLSSTPAVTAVAAAAPVYGPDVTAHMIEVPRTIIKFDRDKPMLGGYWHWLLR